MQNFTNFDLFSFFQLYCKDYNLLHFIKKLSERVRKL